MCLYLQRSESCKKCFSHNALWNDNSNGYNTCCKAWKTTLGAAHLKQYLYLWLLRVNTILMGEAVINQSFINNWNALFLIAVNQLAYTFPGYLTLPRYFTMFPVVFHLIVKVIWQHIYTCFIYIRSEKLEAVSIPHLYWCTVLYKGLGRGHFLTKAFLLKSSIGEKSPERIVLITPVLRKLLCVSLYVLCPWEKCRVDNSCPIHSPDGKSMDSFLQGDIQPYHTFSCQRNKRHHIQFGGYRLVSSSEDRQRLGNLIIRTDLFNSPY